MTAAAHAPAGDVAISVRGVTRAFGDFKALDAVAGDYKSTPASVALAWLMAQPGIAAPIASATNEKQLADLAAAAELKLKRAAIEKLSTASAHTD